jgi:hypothetical protein
MSAWKKVVTAEGATADNSFITINPDSGIEVVRIDDLDPITPDTDSDIAATIANDPENYLFVVDEVDQNAHKKLVLDDLMGAIGASLVLSTDPQAQAYFTGTTSGLAGDLNDDGSVSTVDLLAFLSEFGQTGTAYDSKVNLTTTGTASLSGSTITPQTAATIPFSTADATISSVNVAGEVDPTTETITFQNSSDGTTSDEWFYTHQNRKIRIASPSTVAFSVVTTLTNTWIYFIAKYTTYTTNNVLQATSWVPIKLQTFGTAGPYDVSLDQAVVTQAQVGTAQTGRVEVQIQAYVLNGEDATVSINDLDIQMLRN